MSIPLFLSRMTHIELYKAVNDGDVDKIKNTFSALVNSGVKTRDFWIEWPYLHVARTVEISNLLLNLGADINVKDNSGLTPLHSAIISLKDLVVLQGLISHGANVNATDYEGNTPLILAIIYENLGAIKELIEHGADVNIKTTSSYLRYSTALEIAVRDFKECAKIIIKYSLKKNHTNGDLRKKIDQYIELSNYKELSLYFNDCINEIEHMKLTKLNKYTTVHELMNQLIPLYSSYEILEKVILSNYPIYQDTILPVIKLCIERGAILNKLRELCTHVRLKTLDRDVVLNSDCIFKIIEYLSNDDLMNFMNSFHVTHI